MKKMVNAILNSQKHLLVLILLLVVFISFGVFYFLNGNEAKKDYSNKYNENANQVIIKIDELNIRSEASTKSDVLGKVYKNNVFDVLDYYVIDDFIWFNIRTSNNVEGYIGTPKTMSFVEVKNGELDLKKPSFSLKSDLITVNRYNELNDQLVFAIIEDEIDFSKMEISYSVDLSYKMGKDSYLMTISLKNNDNNTVTSKKISLGVLDERFIKDKWHTKEELEKIKKEYISICSQYTNLRGDWFWASCSTEKWTFSLMDKQAEVVFSGVNTQPHIDAIGYCRFDINFDVKGCTYNNNAVSIEYVEKNYPNILENNLASLKEYISEINNIGYSFSDLN